MNPEKLKKMQAEVRIGGKGTPRRKKKVVHITTGADDKKLQSCLRKISVTTIPGIEEVNMIGEDGSVIHFTNPKVQASLAANTFAITGRGEHKKLTDMVPDIINQLGTESLLLLKRMNEEKEAAANAEFDDLPNLVCNFDDMSTNEAAAVKIENEPKPWPRRSDSTSDSTSNNSQDTDDDDDDDDDEEASHNPETAKGSKDKRKKIFRKNERVREMEGEDESPKPLIKSEVVKDTKKELKKEPKKDNKPRKSFLSKKKK